MELKQWFARLGWGCMSMIHTKFPGKLFLMGEYAIMEPGQVAVIAAVDRFLNVYIEKADDFEIRSAYGHLQGTEIFMQNEILIHVKAAIEISRRYLKYQKIKMEPFKITIDSELDADDHQKYGFGSSGVVVVAVVDAILKQHAIHAEPIELFKLSVMAQVIVGEMSSGGDLASTCFGGIIAYRRYDETWLILEDMSNMELVHTDWPGLMIHAMQTDCFKLCVGWSGNANSTTPYVEKVRELSELEPYYYQMFLLSAERTVGDFIKGCENRDFSMIKKAVELYRGLMCDLGHHADLMIETPKLKGLIECAETFNLPAKISGSGGGDCGFALLPENFHEKEPRLLHEWEKHGILYLDVGVYET